MSYVDLHLHGAFGIDVGTAGPEDLQRLAVLLAGRGYAAFLPTLVPLAPAELEAAVRRLGAWIASRQAGDGKGAVPLGIHFEGPFVAPARAGALHPDRFLDGRREREVERFFALVAAAPGRHVVTLAPEIAGGIELVGEFARRGVLVSLGHTDASIGILEDACVHGARHMTHFCNAMRPLHHREVGPIGFGLLTDAVTIDVIADLHHLAPAMLRLVLKAKGADRVALISDAMPAAGLPDGDYPVWGETLSVHSGTARNAAGALAGSVQLLDEAERNLQRATGASPELARACASSVPWRILFGQERASAHAPPPDLDLGRGRDRA